MEGPDYKALSHLILRARELTETDRRPCWTRNAVIHVRLSHLIGLLWQHPSLQLVPEGGLAGGRIRIVDPSGGSALLLKPRGAIAHSRKPDEADETWHTLDSGSDPSGDPLSQSAAQPPLPGLGRRSGRSEDPSSQAFDESRHVEEASEPERLLAYDVIGDAHVVFAEGMSRRVKYLGGTEDHLEGDLIDVWDSREQPDSESFDQAEGADWTEYLQDPVEGLEQESG